MPYETTRGLFNEIDTNNDGKIDRSELSEWASNEVRRDATSPSTHIVSTEFSTVSHGGADFGAGASYEVDASFGTGTNSLYDRIDLNRNNVIERSEFNQFASGGTTIVDTSSNVDYVSKYRTDSRGFYLDPNPEIITRPDPGPAPTYKQHITIRYLQPPPLPPVGENVIREVRAPPLQPPPPFLIREPGKPGFQPPPLILRERPPTPPPVQPPITKTVIIPPLPAPPRSVVTEKFPDLPDRPRDIILERWLPYERRTASRTVRIPAPTGPLPDPPRNRIIQYQALPAHVVREFQRLGVTRADPEAYRRQYGSNLLDSITFVQQARAVGVVEDLSLPAGSIVGYAASSHVHGDGTTHSYLGDVTANTIIGSAEYTRTSGSKGAYGGRSRSSERITRGSRYGRGYDVTGTTIHSDEIISDTEVGGFLQQRL